MQAKVRYCRDRLLRLNVFGHASWSRTSIGISITHLQVVSEAPRSRGSFHPRSPEHVRSWTPAWQIDQLLPPKAHAWTYAVVGQSPRAQSRFLAEVVPSWPYRNGITLIPDMCGGEESNEVRTESAKRKRIVLPVAALVAVVWPERDLLWSGVVVERGEDRRGRADRVH